MSVISLAIALAGALGTASIANAAPYWAYNYYNNYFMGYEQCAARGGTMMRTVYGVEDYRCHIGTAGGKWSMDIKWSGTEFDTGGMVGGGVGGGGGGSW
jgi:hypothetical protein